VDTPRDDQIARQWGYCGVVVWVKFMQACKRAAEPGRVPFHSEDQLATELRIAGWPPLVDVDGKPFTLAEFFQWTGKRKWTVRHRGSWPAVEYRGWAEEQETRQIPSGSSRNPSRSREKRRSEGRNASPKRRGEETPPLGGASPLPESSDAPSARSPQGARSGRSGEDLQDHPDHEVGDWEVCRPVVGWCDHGACRVECGRCRDEARRTA
jgi:hypothetical protein